MERCLSSGRPTKAHCRRQDLSASTQGDMERHLHVTSGQPILATAIKLHNWNASTIWWILLIKVRSTRCLVQESVLVSGRFLVVSLSQQSRSAFRYPTARGPRLNHRYGSHACTCSSCCVSIDIQVRLIPRTEDRRIKKWKHWVSTDERFVVVAVALLYLQHLIILLRFQISFLLSANKN